jgi:hypothetical protein
MLQHVRERMAPSVENDRFCNKSFTREALRSPI